MSNFLQIMASKPGAYQGNLLVGNPDANVTLTGGAIPLEFDEAHPALTVDGRTRESRLITILASVPFELAMVGPTETLETVETTEVYGAFEFLFARDGAAPVCQYAAIVPGGVSKIYVRSFEEVELDSNS
jgi:hypothetical protein